MSDPRDIAEQAVLSIPPDTFRKFVDQYNLYQTFNNLLYLRAQIAIEASRATAKPEVTQEQ